MKRPLEGSGKPPDGEGGGQVSVHTPVLLREALEVLDLAAGMTVVDGTVGAAGHGRELARAVGPDGLFIGLDRDEVILARARKALAATRDVSGARVRFRLHHLSFDRMQQALEQEGLACCDRVFLDLGVSSLQLDTPARGFSFINEGPLDMRMDGSSSLTAADWLADIPENELSRVLFEYGGERHNRRVARAIVERRNRAPIVTTSQLVEVVLGALPGNPWRQRIHPATRVFQAIRIAVNEEFQTLERGLQVALECLVPGGRLAVISFHSLEDRSVKQFLRERMVLPFRKPIAPSREEKQRNPRARSARLRCGIVRAA
ncbi:MAG: 16S rRNA (cytosine(1402)-N(4))-methyltransferase RsmH [Planctomycetota bacterium]